MPRVVFYWNEQIRQRLVDCMARFKRELNRFEEEMSELNKLHNAKFIRLYDIRDRVQNRGKLVFEEDAIEQLEKRFSNHDCVVFVHLCQRQPNQQDMTKRIYESNCDSVQIPTRIESESVLYIQPDTDVATEQPAQQIYSMNPAKRTDLSNSSANNIHSAD